MQKTPPELQIGDSIVVSVPMRVTVTGVAPLRYVGDDPDDPSVYTVEWADPLMFDEIGVLQVGALVKLSDEPPEMTAWAQEYWRNHA